MRPETVAFVAVVAALASACGSSPSAAIEANKDLVRRFVEVGNTADWDALDDLLTEDFARHSQATAGVQVTSRDEFKALQASFLETFPDQHVTVDLMVAEGDLVALHATYAGTQTGPMGDFPATGRRAESQFMGIFRVEDGRLAELWVEWDNLAMLTQLGHFPPPPGG